MYSDVTSGGREVCSYIWKRYAPWMHWWGILPVMILGISFVSQGCHGEHAFVSWWYCTSPIRCESNKFIDPHTLTHPLHMVKNNFSIYFVSYKYVKCNGTRARRCFMHVWRVFPTRRVFLSFFLIFNILHRKYFLLLSPFQKGENKSISKSFHLEKSLAYKNKTSNHARTPQNIGELIIYFFLLPRYSVTFTYFSRYPAGVVCFFFEFPAHSWSFPRFKTEDYVAAYSIPFKFSVCILSVFLDLEWQVCGWCVCMRKSHPILWRHVQSTGNVFSTVRVSQRYLSFSLSLREISLYCS